MVKLLVSSGRITAKPFGVEELTVKFDAILFRLSGYFRYGSVPGEAKKLTRMLGCGMET